MMCLLFVIPASLLPVDGLPAADRTVPVKPTIHVAVVNGLARHGPWTALAAGFAGQGKIETLELRRDEAIEALHDEVADAALVHEAPDLSSLVESGLIEQPIPWAYSGYLLVGPVEDPAEARSAPTAAGALKAILSAKARVLIPGGRGAAAKWKELLTEAGQSPPIDAAAADPERDPLNQAAALRAYSLIPRQSDLLEAAPGLKMACFAADDPALRHAFVMLIRRNSPQATQAKTLATYLVSDTAVPFFTRPAGQAGRWLDVSPRVERKAGPGQERP